MEWTDVADCELLERLKAGVLPHPTNAAFVEKLWRDALQSLSPASQRDEELAVAAIYFGRELTRLRSIVEVQILAGLTRKRAIRLLSALANQQYLTLLSKVKSAIKSRKKAAPIHFEQMNRHLFDGGFGQQMTADDAATALVDSLPNWLHHIWSIPADAEALESSDPVARGSRAMMMASIERGLRDLWQGSLWEGDKLRLEAGTKVQVPGDRGLDQLWLIWHMRNTALYSFEHSIDAGAWMVTGGKLPPIQPVSARTVTKIGRRRDGRRRFVVRAANGRSPEQRGHVSERDMLNRLHVGLFLDEALPKHGEPSLTCRDLSHAWWVLMDLARLVLADLGTADLPDDRAVGRFAFATDLGDLTHVLVAALGISSSRARAILDLFACDPSDTQYLFRKGLWAKPLLPQPDSDRRYVIFAPLMIGSPIRRIEAWMAEGGIADGGGLKGRGKPYEAFVRRTLAKELADNPIITDFAVEAEAFKPKGEGEEIDLLVRIGETVVVGEVKCFTTPTEPIERANFLRSIAKATGQARRKVDWAADNRAIVAGRLGVADPVRIAALNFTPVVILAQSFGVGLSRDGVPVVDYHFFRLLLGSNEYQGDTWFERGIGMTAALVTLYKDQGDLERRLPDLIGNPQPLKRYRKAVGWRRRPFATSDGSTLLLEFPELVGPPSEAGTLSFPSHIP